MKLLVALDDLRAEHLAVERIRPLPVGHGDDDVIDPEFHRASV